MTVRVRTGIAQMRQLSQCQRRKQLLGLGLGLGIEHAVVHRLEQAAYILGIDPVLFLGSPVGVGFRVRVRPRFASRSRV